MKKRYKKDKKGDKYRKVKLIKSLNVLVSKKNYREHYVNALIAQNVPLGVIPIQDGEICHVNKWALNL